MKTIKATLTEQEGDKASASDTGPVDGFRDVLVNDWNWSEERADLILKETDEKGIYTGEVTNHVTDTTFDITLEKVA